MTGLDFLGTAALLPGLLLHSDQHEWAKATNKNLPT